MAEDGSASVSRRGLLRFGGAAALVVGFCIPLRGATEAAERAAFAPNAFVRVDHKGDVTLVMPQVEMGQGTYTSISMILAEELDADWSRVRFEHAPPDEAHYANPMLSIQATGSRHERTGLPPMCTVQAPHWAMPHPNLVPVRPRMSRSTQSSGVSGATSTARAWPFTVREITRRLLASRH